MMELARLSLPLPLRLSQLNAYLIRGAAGAAALVDTGMATPAGREALVAALAEHGLKPAEVREVYITHLHGDHWGHAGWLREQGARVLMPRVDADMIRGWFDHPEYDASAIASYRAQGVPAEVLERAGRALARMREMAPSFDVDRKLEDGERFELAGERFEVILTPGHTPGHGCLHHLASRTLLVGDHVLPVITPNISRDLGGPEDPLADYRRSLARVRGQGYGPALPAHGLPLADLDRRIDELLQHHEEREARVLAVVGEGAATCYEVAGGLFRLGELDSWETWMALGETSAHLAGAVGRGRLVRELRSGVELYRR